MTTQKKEYLVFEGKKVPLLDYPSLPEDGTTSAIVKLKEENMGEYEKRFICFSTACRRGYIGSWEIKDEKLYLANISGRYRLLADDSVLADWFTGQLSFFQDETMQFTEIQVNKGVVVDVKTEQVSQDSPRYYRLYLGF